MALGISQRVFFNRAAFFCLAALFCTYLRVSLLLFYPLVVAMAYYAFHWKISANARLLLGLTFVLWLLSFRNGFFLRYNLVSFYYFIPFIFLLTAAPRPRTQPIDNLRIFMIMLTVIALVNDVIGIVQYALHPGDDNFVGVYGQFTVSQNGLSLLNGILFFYYLATFLRSKGVLALSASVFFLSCAVLGFYGAGQIVLLGAVAGAFINLRLKNILLVVLFGTLTFLIVVLLMKAIAPNTFDYNVAVLKRFLTSDAATTARKKIAFINYFKGYGTHPADLLLGSGPGTFNSRSAFMVGSPTYFNIGWIKSPDQPYYFRTYAYTLWNPTNTGPYDGFMNQPFSSMLALAGEYGLILTVLIAGFAITTFRRVSATIASHAKRVNLTVEGYLFKFCWVMAMLLLVIDNYMEYPEVIGLVLIVAKLSHQEIRRKILLNDGRAAHALT